MNQYIDYLQKRIAESAVGASTLRNQGAPGVVEAAGSYLKKVKLKNLSNIRYEVEYARFLNRHTGKLKNKFHGRTKGNWGAARKALNIFFRDVAYNASEIALNLGVARFSRKKNSPLTCEPLEPDSRTIVTRKDDECWGNDRSFLHKTLLAWKQRSY